MFTVAWTENVQKADPERAEQNGGHIYILIEKKTTIYDLYYIIPRLIVCGRNCNNQP